MKKTFVRVLTLVCMLVLLSATYVSAFAASRDKTLHIEIDDVTESRDGLIVTLDVDNRTGYEISFGWVSHSEVVVVTDEDTYRYESPNGPIPCGESELVLELDGCCGEIEKLTITDLRQLDSRGLPDRKMKEVTVYDAAQGIDEFEGKFSLVTSDDFPLVIVFSLMVVVILVVIAIWIRTRRRNVKALQQYASYAATPAVGNVGHVASTATAQNTAGTYCVHCGAPLQAGGAFCAACGEKQVTRYQQTFYRGSMKEDELIDQINLWFAQYPQVANVSGKFFLKHCTGLMVNKYVLDAFAIEYEVFNNPNQNQYAVVRLGDLGLVRTDTDELLALWKQENPHTTVINTNGGINQRGTSGSLALGGFGATNNTQLYVFFKFDRATGTGTYQ